jgi:hypothetical protein
LHEAGTPEHGEVLRNGLLGHVDFFGDLPDGARTLAKHLEDLEATRFAERLESEGGGGGFAFHKWILV